MFYFLTLPLRLAVVNLLFLEALNTLTNITAKYPKNKVKNKTTADR
ncbi:hypothetical protein [Brochothrix phage BtpYZU04]